MKPAGEGKGELQACVLSRSLSLSFSPSLPELRSQVSLLSLLGVSGGLPSSSTSFYLSSVSPGEAGGTPHQHSAREPPLDEPGARHQQTGQRPVGA